MLTSLNGVAAALAAALIVTPLPVAAQAPRTGTALQTPALDRWAVEAQRSLQRRLTDPRPIGKPSGPEGVVDVAFRIDAAGRPAQVAVFHSSGSRAVDGQAAKAVRRIRTATAPGAVDRTYLARIFFVGGDGRFDEARRRELVARTAAAHGWAKADALAGDRRGTMLLAARR
ncbi:TonB family protein [Sphingomonas endolithica]|uniref:TonB family protein n=1 Tax=Sphingomonas endolithica TaxID=2972485 RepID=UPI0021B03117|nr:TonB family protein [Sphingomonas sp. ZFBP2030]